MSVEYYNKNAEAFIERTFELDMSYLLNKFIKFIPNGGTILDIGCGSGRDSKWFLENGYNVYAIDGSEKFVEHTKSIIGDKAQQCMFDQFRPIDLYGRVVQFDGLWASASLLHVPQDELIYVIDTFMYYLKADGVFFLSFKKAKKDYVKDNRHFTNFTIDMWNEFIEGSHFANVVEIFETEDIREGKEGETWINIILEKYL